MAGVLPGGGRQDGVRFGRVRGLWWVGGVRGVEVGVEGEGVVASRCSVPMLILVCGVARGQGVVDGVGQQRVRADFDEGGVVGAGRLAMAWLNRTGLRRLAAQWSASNTVVRPILRRRSSGGGDDRDGRGRRRQIGERRRAIRAASGRSSDDARPPRLRRAGPTGPARGTTAISASTASGGPAITVWRGEA